MSRKYDGRMGLLESPDLERHDGGNEKPMAVPIRIKELKMFLYKLEDW